MFFATQLNNPMKRLLLTLIATFITIFSLPVSVNAAATVTASVCDQDSARFTLTMTDTPGTTWGVRVDDTSSPWTAPRPQARDFLEDNYKSNTFLVRGRLGYTYNWWVHPIKNGVYQAPISGTTHCSIGSVTDLKVGKLKEDSYVLLWNGPDGSVKNALRIDDWSTPWGGDRVLAGDVVDNNVNGRYILNGQKGHKYTFWVHAIDQSGRYSPASQSFTFEMN